MAGNYKKGIWVELIGFDRTKPDYGVKEYLDRMPEKPELISLLLFSTELIHNHNGLEKDFFIGDEQCSYYGRPYNEERQRQDWSAFELRGLVAELKKYSIKVLPSFFDMTVSAKTAETLALRRKEPVWADEHPEVMYVLKNGQNTHCIFPLKHLADGSLYEDFFADKLIAFLKDYGFSGFHGCDGFGHPRYALCDADFSRDMLEQFTAFTGRELPEDMPVETLSGFILKNLRKEWALFYAQRHASFWEKIAGRLKKEGLLCFLNTCWTRDPHEALFRYGIDYRKLAQCNIDGFFAEASAAVLELEGWNDTESSCIEKCQSMFMRIKAMVPDTPIWLLGCIKDGMEQYNALRHAPGRMRTEAYTLYNLYYNKQRCAEGILECLGDGISSGEWQIVDSIRSLASSGAVKDLICAHVLWDDGAFDREFAYYASMDMQERISSSHTLFYELIHAGAVLPSVISTEAALQTEKNAVSSSLVVFHPYFLEPGIFEQLKEKFSFLACIGLQGDGNSAIIFTKDGQEIFREKIQWKEAEKLEESSSWLTCLSEKHVGKDLLERAALLLDENTSMVCAEKDREFLRLWCVQTDCRKYRIFARSEKSVYLNSVIRVQAEVAKVIPLTQDPSLPVKIFPKESENGENEDKKYTLLHAKIPPYGTIVLEMETK